MEGRDSILVRLMPDFLNGTRISCKAPALSLISNTREVLSACVDLASDFEIIRKRVVLLELSSIEEARILKPYVSAAIDEAMQAMPARLVSLATICAASAVLLVGRRSTPRKCASIQSLHWPNTWSLEYTCTMSLSGTDLDIKQ